MKYLISMTMSIALGASSTTAAFTTTQYKDQATPNPELRDVQFQKKWDIGDLLDLSGLQWGLFEGDITVSKNFYLANKTLPKFEFNLIKTLCQTSAYYGLIVDMTNTEVLPGLPHALANTLKQPLTSDWNTIQQDFVKTASTGHITLSWSYVLHGYYTNDSQTKKSLVLHGSQFSTIL